MKNLNCLNEFRKKHLLFPDLGDGGNGYFEIPNLRGPLRVIATDGFSWDHVSVSLINRCANWHEMKMIKERFFLDEEVAYQIFPPKKLYVNCHPHVLHWWRPQNQEVMLPPLRLL